MSKQCTKPKRKRDDSWFKDKVLLVQAQANDQILHEKELSFLADLGIVEAQATQTVITHNVAYQVDDLDACDSDCDEINTVKVGAEAGCIKSYDLSSPAIRIEGPLDVILRLVRVKIGMIDANGFLVDFSGNVSIDDDSSSNEET
nr:hypothetical protein [Tanacetum cinerariifolium]